MWTDQLVREYQEGKKRLNKLYKSMEADDPERKIISGMIRDMEFAIEWLETGMMPVELLYRSHRYKAFRNDKKFVYGVDGYWDESVGGFIGTNAYVDPYKEVEDKIDRELAMKRAKAS